MVCSADRHGDERIELAHAKHQIVLLKRKLETLLREKAKADAESFLFADRSVAPS
jgi:hypothetical protein